MDISFILLLSTICFAGTVDYVHIDLYLWISRP